MARERGVSDLVRLVARTWRTLNMAHTGTEEHTHTYSHGIYPMYLNTDCAVCDLWLQTPACSPRLGAWQGAGQSPGRGAGDS